MVLCVKLHIWIGLLLFSLAVILSSKSLEFRASTCIKPIHLCKLILQFNCCYHIDAKD